MSLSKEVKEDDIYLFYIPDYFKKPIPALDGLSEFGRNYSYVKSVFDEFAEILKSWVSFFFIFFESF